MTIQIPSTILDAWSKQHRPTPFFNTTSEDIPPFACMLKRKAKQFSETAAAKNTDEADKFFSHHLRGNQLVWDVAKCTEEAAELQDPSAFLFNGPVPCPSLRYSVGTEELPAQVLHDGMADSLPNGTTCGPVADRWYVLSTGSAWTCICHDLAFAAGRGKIHTVWIGHGAGRKVSAHARWPIAASGLAADDYCTWGQVGSASLVKSVEIDADTPEWLIVRRDGLYLLSLSGTLYSSDAARGDALSLTLWKKDDVENDGDEEATPYVVERLQDIEVDSTDLLTTRENVSITGFENLRKGDGLAWKNSCQKLLTLTRGIFSIVQIGARYTGGDTAPDSGGLDTSAT